MFSDFSQKMYIRVVKTNFYVFRKSFEETDFSEKITSCVVHTRTLSIIFLTFGTSFPVKFSKLLPTVSDGHFDGKQFFLKNFFNLLNFGRNSFFWLMTIFLLQNCQNCFLRLQRNTLIKNFFWKTLPHFFRTVSISFSDFRQNFYRGLSKLFSTCSEILLKMRIFSMFCFWSIFRFWANFSLTFGTNLFVRLSKLLSPCLDEHFDGKFFFGKFFNLSSDFERIIFWTWVTVSQKSSQKRILRVQKTFWGNWLFGEFFDPYVY